MMLRDRAHECGVSAGAQPGVAPPGLERTTPTRPQGLRPGLTIRRPSRARVRRVNAVPGLALQGASGDAGSRRRSDGKRVTLSWGRRH